MDEFQKNVAAGLISNAIWLCMALLTPFLIYFAVHGYRTLRLLRRLKRNGVVAFFPNRDSYTRDRQLSLEKYLETAENSLLYVGHWLAVSTDQRDTLVALRNILLRGKTVTIVMLSGNLTPERLSAYALFFGREIADIQTQIQSGWANVETWRRALGREESGKLTVKMHSEFISHSAFGFDLGQKQAKILIDQKLWGLDRRNSYGIELIANPKIDVDEVTLFTRYEKSITALRDCAIAQPL